MPICAKKKCSADKLSCAALLALKLQGSKEPSVLVTELTVDVSPLVDEVVLVNPLTVFTVPPTRFVAVVVKVFDVLVKLLAVLGDDVFVVLDVEFDVFDGVAFNLLDDVVLVGRIEVVLAKLLVPELRVLLSVPVVLPTICPT